MRKRSRFFNWPAVVGLAFLAVFAVMTQRLGLAVAILPDAPLLLLDEPTAALDPQGLEAFYELIETRRKNGQTVVFSSHSAADVERLATRIIVMEHGRVVKDARQIAGEGQCAR